MTKDDDNKERSVQETKKELLVKRVQDKDDNDDEVVVPVMTTSLVLYWILPVIVLGLWSRWGIQPPESRLPKHPALDTAKSSVMLDMNQLKQDPDEKKKKKKKKRKKQNPNKYSEGYQEVLDIVNQRRRKYNVPQLKYRASNDNDTSNVEMQQPKQMLERPKELDPLTPKKERTKKEVPKAPPRSGTHNVDPARAQADTEIERLRQQLVQNPNHVYTIIALADAMRHRDYVFHDGGSVQMEAIQLYQQAIDLVLKEESDIAPERSSTTTTSLQQEMFLPMESKSPKGLLCSLYTAQGKMYFMANMFEKAVESYEHVLFELEPLYLDALGSLGSSLLILGRYKEAGEAYHKLLNADVNRVFFDGFTGMAKVLTVKEDAVDGGWTTMVELAQEQIARLETKIPPESGRKMWAESLNRLHHAMYMYHDVKTKDAEQAWFHLTSGYQYKMSVLPQWNGAFEAQKNQQTMQIFRKGFWPPNVGSSTQTPVFIIGFVRSGSTLLERVLDAHPLIVGTGEDSVFNGRLDEIRNAIVEASWQGNTTKIAEVVQQQADMVVEGMRSRWLVLEENVDRKGSTEEPQRFADKMLTNYLNVGFMHMLFPKALILHVAREPMDTVFSAYKHEFPPGTLDYTSQFESLAQLYSQYRDVMDHWDDVLPGRVTHVRYEDMVHDMPGMARAIIKATGLEWSEEVLDFHKKKHAVNTLSTTQVRKKVYKDSLLAWKVYEKQLQPLVELLGDRATWDLKTTLPGYVKPEA